MEQQTKSAFQRIYWLDVARSFAILSITFNHAVNRSFDNYENTLQEFLTLPAQQLWLKTLITVYSRIGVPVFLMISGYLLLNKRIEDGKDIAGFYRHNFLRLFLTSEIWIVIMYWVLIIGSPDLIPWKESVNAGAIIGNLFLSMGFLNQTTMGSMWYIQMILPVYMVVPVLAMVVKKLPRCAWIPVSAVGVSWILLPFLNSVFRFCEIDFQLNFAINSDNLFSFYLIYLLMGYFIGNGILKQFRTWHVALICLSSFAFCVWYQYLGYSKPGNYLIPYYFFGIMVCSAFLFELFRRGSDRLLFLRRPVTHMAKISFGIFFVHIIIMSILQWTIDYSSWTKPQMLFFLEGVSVGGSILLVSLTARIPFAKKYFYMIKD